MKVTLPLSPRFLETRAQVLSPVMDPFERTGTLHPAILLTGPEGVGKKSLIAHFVQTMFCDESIFANSVDAEEDSPGLFGDPAPAPRVKKTGRSPCGKCASCSRSAQGQWLDLYWFDPESADEETRLGTHKIEAFRELKSKLGLGPSQEPFKVVVIADADRMTPQAANSILKVLEEPPRNWVFLLTASDSSRLLPTILSRCMELRTGPHSPDSLFAILKDAKGADFQSERARVASRAAQGSLSRALFYTSDDAWSLRNQWISLLSNPAGEWTRMIDQLSKHQIQTHLGLDLLESILMDLLRSGIEGDSHVWTHSDQRELLLQIRDSRKLDPARLCALLELVVEKRKWVNLTLNSRLLAQEILIPILEAV